MSDEWPDRLNNEFLELKSFATSQTIWLMTFKFRTFTLKGIEAINRALDYLDTVKGEIGLITTSSDSKIYSAGIDFTQFGVSRQYTIGFLMHFQKLFARFLSLSYPTVAAINGHCIAGGIMLAMAHDFRVQRGDLGIISMSEISLGMPIPWGMLFLIRDKISYPTLRMLAQFGHKFTPQESLKGGLVDQLCDPKEVVDQAVKLLQPFVEKSSARGAFAQIKSALNHRGIKAANQDFLPPEELIDSLKAPEKKKPVQQKL
jgi:Delta3-Delta2-enoyl-CoA isomerase